MVILVLGFKVLVGKLQVKGDEQESMGLPQKVFATTSFKMLENSLFC